MKITAEHIEATLAGMRCGRSLASMARELGLNEDSLRDRCAKHPDYARARQTQGDAHYDRVIDLALQVARGEIDPAAARAASDNFKWTAGRMRPDIYGERKTIAGDKDAPLQHEHKHSGALDKLAAALGRGDG